MFYFGTISWYTNSLWFLFSLSLISFFISVGCFCISTMIYHCTLCNKSLIFFKKRHCCAINRPRSLKSLLADSDSSLYHLKERSFKHRITPKLSYQLWLCQLSFIPPCNKNNAKRKERHLSKLNYLNHPCQDVLSESNTVVFGTDASMKPNRPL